MNIKNKHLLSANVDENDISNMIEKIVDYINNNIYLKLHESIPVQKNKSINFIYVDHGINPYSIDDVPSTYDFNLKEKINFLTIELSDEIKNEAYIGLDLSTVKKTLINKIKNLKTKDIDNLIDDINKANSKKELMRLSESIAKVLSNNKEDEENNFNEVHEKVRDLIGQISFVGLILGEYQYNTRWDDSIIDNSDLIIDNEKIVLYVKNIESSANDYGGILKAYEAVLCHEIFHFYHGMETFVKEEMESSDIYEFYYPYDFHARNDYASSVIKESFASFFEYNYCKDRGIINNVSSKWSDNSVIIYPYSGAKAIKKFDIFVYLFKECVTNETNIALLYLCNQYENNYKKLAHGGMDSRNFYELYYKLINKK